MIQVSQAVLKKAVNTAFKAVGKNEPLCFMRLVRVGDHLRVMATNRDVVVDRYVPITEPSDTAMDLLVLGEKLKATVRALRSGPVTLNEDDGVIHITQGMSSEITLETMPANVFPKIEGFDNMQPVYEGENPASGYEALKSVAENHVGSQPLTDALIIMNGRSYIATNSAAVRCDFSLMGLDLTPFALKLESTWVLADMAKEVRVFLDDRRVLVLDDQGYTVIMQHGQKPGNFAHQVDQTFASLTEIGQVRIPREEAKRAVSAAATILKTKEPVYLSVKCFREQVEITGEIGRQKFVEHLPAKCSGEFLLWVHLPRFRAFLQTSDDDYVILKVMDSDMVPNPMCAVHLVDSRLHEVISLPQDRPIQVMG